MTDAKVLSAAQSLHQAYDRIQMRRWKLFTPRWWINLPPNCQQEFIDIAQAVLDGKDTCRGEPIPQWVKDHINKNSA